MRRPTLVAAPALVAKLVLTAGTAGSSRRERRTMVARAPGGYPS